MNSSSAGKLNKYLTRYVAFITAAMAIIQGYITWNNNQIDVLSMVMLAGVAVVYFYFGYTQAFLPGKISSAIRRTPYSRLMIHVVTYLIVNVSYGIHGFILYIQNAELNDGQLLFDQGWFGPLVAMPTWWGLGLLIDTLVTWYKKGFDDANI